MSPPSHDGDAIAATLRIAHVNEELRPRPAGLEIAVLDGIDEGAHSVLGEEITVGRGTLCDITLKDSSVSEFHFRLTVGTEEVLIEDLDSSNGLWIGRARVERAYLLPGARFRAGKVRMQLHDIATAPCAVARDDDFFGLRGRSESMRSIFALLARTAPTPLPVLVSGETGVGKGQLVRALHRASGRKGPLVTIDCSALPREMAEGSLFGHLKGAYTGANADRPSPFEDAKGGTLFLDEIGELPSELQPKLLRVIDERVVQRLGSNEPRPVDIRVIAATNRDLVQEVSAGRFRPDLYHRIAGIVIRMQPLRNRREDIPFLASLFIEEACAQMERTIELEPDLSATLAQRHWAGNVRELRHAVHRAAYLCEGSTLTPADFTRYDEEDLADTVAIAAGPESNGLSPLAPLLAEFKRDYCRKALAQSPSMAAAARVAGFTPPGFRVMLGKLGIRAREHLMGQS